jgi:hypothetical protein
MAKEDEKKSAAADAGKGKAVNNGESSKDPKKDKDGKGEKDGEKLDLPPDELSEEDQQLKDELDMLVERLLVCLACIQAHNRIASAHDEGPQSLCGRSVREP